MIASRVRILLQIKVSSLIFAANELLYGRCEAGALWSYVDG